VLCRLEGPGAKTSAGAAGNGKGWGSLNSPAGNKESADWLQIRRVGSHTRTLKGGTCGGRVQICVPLGGDYHGRKSVCGKPKISDPV